MSAPSGRYRAFGGEAPAGALSAGDALGRPLTVPLLVRGALDNRPLQVLLWVAGGLLALGTCVLFQRPGPGRPSSWAPLATGGLISIPGLALLFYLLRRRLWLQVTATGLVVTSRTGSRAYSDDQVIALSRDSRTAADGSVTHRAWIEVAGASRVERLGCRYHLAANQPDPLAALWDRIAAQLARRGQEALAGGQALEGAGWRLDAHALHAAGEQTALDRLRKVGYYDARLCVWRDDEERPFLRLARGGRNVQPLALLLWQLLQANPAANQPVPGRPLGRVLLDRRSRDWRALLLIAAFFAPIMAFVAGRQLLAPWPTRRPMGVGLSLVFASLLLSFLALAVWSWFTRLRFHEWGVVQPGLWGHRVLRYDDIVTMICRGTYRLTFAAAPGSGLPRIRYRCLSSEGDEGLRALVIHIAWLIAQRWAERLAHGPVAWTLRLRFLPGGLEYRPWQLFGMAPPIVVPYQYTHYEIVGDELHLFVQGGDTPVCKESLASANFYPGLALLDRIYAGESGPDLSAAHAPRPSATPGGECETRIRGEGPSSLGGITPGP